MRRFSSCLAVLGLAVVRHDASAQLNFYPHPCESSYGAQDKAHGFDSYIISVTNPAGHGPIGFKVTGYTLVTSGGSALTGYYGSFATVLTVPQTTITATGPFVIGGQTYSSIDSVWNWVNARVQLTNCRQADVPDGEVVRADIAPGAESGSAEFFKSIRWLQTEECVPINHSGDCESSGPNNGGADQWYMCTYWVYDYPDGREVWVLIQCTPM